MHTKCIQSKHRAPNPSRGITSSDLPELSHPQLGQPTPRCELTATHPNQPHLNPTKMHVHQGQEQKKPEPSPEPPHRRRPPDRTPSDRAPRGGSGGRPRASTASHSRSWLKASEVRATPGGYGGKPPGVAIIGVPTGARNAGSGAPTGDQSTDMNATRKHPLVCQDPIATRSLQEAEQRNQLSPPPGRAGRWPLSEDGPAGSRVAGRLGWYSMKPRVLLGSRPPLANTTAK